MRHNKKGVSVIVGTVLLMLIGVAGSIIIYNAFSNLSTIGPDPGTATILENVKINQVTRYPSNASLAPLNFTIYFQNTGLVNETIDSIYILDENENLVYVYPINAVQIAPHDYANITLDTSERNATDWVYFQAFTTRGDSDMLDVTPIGPTYISFTDNAGLAIINNETDLPGLNNTYVNDTYYFDTTSDSSSYTAPPIHPEAAWNPVTGSREVGGGGADIHIQHDGAVACSARIPNPFMLQSLDVSININGPNSCYGVYNLSFYNWNTNNQVLMITKAFRGDFVINYILNETNVMAYVNPNTTFVFQLDVWFNKTGTGTLKFDFDDVNIVPTYRGSYDGIFVFNITEPYNLINEMTFDTCLSSNVSGTIMEFRIYNYKTGAWDAIDYYPLPINWTFYSYQTTLTVNCIDYVDPVLNEVRIGFAPYFVLGGDVDIRYNFIEMQIQGIKN